MKAYIVTEDVEGTGGIVFAKSAAAARKEGACTFGDGDMEGYESERASWADQFEQDNAPGLVAAMIDHGWHFECGECGARIEDSYLQETDRFSEEVVGVQHGLIFCDALCQAKFALNKAGRERTEQRWLRRFKKIIARRFGKKAVIVEGTGGTYAYATAPYRVNVVRVSFSFPGMALHPASLEYALAANKKISFYCAKSEQSAFEKFAKKTKVTRK
jgi:hypothetical protein